MESCLEEILLCIVNNKDWLFSGLGITILTVVVIALTFIWRLIKNRIAQDELLKIESFEILNPDGVKTTQIRFYFGRKQHIESTFVTANIKTLASWDFYTGEVAAGGLHFTPPPSPPYLLISTDNDSSTSINLVFDAINSDSNSIMLNLYTDHLIKDSHGHEVGVGGTVFLLDLTISTTGFRDWKATIIVRLDGGYALTILKSGVTEKRVIEQSNAAKTILQAVKNGAYINNALLKDLKESYMG